MRTGIVLLILISIVLSSWSIWTLRGPTQSTILVSPLPPLPPIILPPVTPVTSSVPSVKVSVPPETVETDATVVATSPETNRDSPSSIKPESRPLKVEDLDIPMFTPRKSLLEKKEKK